jgi:hypothetical protein
MAKKIILVAFASLAQFLPAQSSHAQTLIESPPALPAKDEESSFK